MTPLAASATARIPPPPWATRGAALVIVGRLGRAATRSLAGDARGLVAPWPLGSVGAVGFIRYDETPVGPYHELAVAPGILWRDLPGALISHMLVDQERSLLAGRALWNLPKTLGQFAWTATGITVADAAGTPLVTARYTLRRGPLPVVAPLIPVIGLRGPRRVIFGVSGWARQARWARVRLEFPPASPLAPLAALTRGPHLALWIEDFHLRVSTPYDLF